MSPLLTLTIHYSTVCIFIVSMWKVGFPEGRGKASVRDATFSVMVMVRCTCSQVGLHLRSWPNSTTEAAPTTRSRICRCTNVKGGVGRSRTARQLPSGKRNVCQYVLCRVRSPSWGTAQRTDLDLSSGDGGRVSGYWFTSRYRVHIALCWPLLTENKWSSQNTRTVLWQCLKSWTVSHSQGHAMPYSIWECMSEWHWMEHKWCTEVRTQTNVFGKRHNSVAGIFASLTPCCDPHSFIPYAVSHLPAHAGAIRLRSYSTVHIIRWNV